MNAPTILIALVIAAVFVAIVARGIHNRRQGKGGCGCESCPGHGACHPKT